MESLLISQVMVGYKTESKVDDDDDDDDDDDRLFSAPRACKFLQGIALYELLLLLYSAILRPRADLLRSHVILHE